MGILDSLNEQVRAEENEHRDQVEEYVEEAIQQVTEFVHATKDMLRAEFDEVVDDTFRRALENGTILAMNSYTMKQSVNSRLYLRSLETALGKTTGVADMMRELVKSNANATAQIAVEKALNYRRASIDKEISDWVSTAVDTGML